MKRSYLWLLISIIVLCGVFLAGCGVKQEDDQRILRARLYLDIKNLDPAFIASANDDTVTRAVCEGLIRYLPNTTEIENLLAEWFNISEDGLEIHFKLKEGIMWQKGYGELTTEDVKFSFERFKDPELASPYAEDWAALDHVEIIDKYEGKIILNDVQATVLTTTLPLTAGLIICKKQVEEIGLDKFATDIVGTGPYVFDEWKPNERVVLKPNLKYWGEEPYWGEIHLIPISEDSSAEIALESGEIDYSEISVASTEIFDNNPDFKVMPLPACAFSWVGMNVENPKLANINIRQAIRYAVDVPSILEAAYHGKVEQAHAIIPPGVFGFWEDAPVYERDLEKAQAYMDKAGVTSLDLKIDCESILEYQTWAQVIQQNLADIGITVTINTHDGASFWELGFGDKGNELELFCAKYSSLPDPAWYTMWFTKDQIGVWNWMRWDSPEYDNLHEEALSTMDLEQRYPIYIKMQELWDEAAHTVWITHSAVVAHSTKIVPVTYIGERTMRICDFRLSE